MVKSTMTNSGVLRSRRHCFGLFRPLLGRRLFFRRLAVDLLFYLRVRLTENRQQIQDHHITFTSLFLKSIVPFGYFLCVLILCDKLNWISQFLSARKFNVLSMSYRIAIRTVSNVGERAIIRDCRSCAIAEIFSRVHSRRTELN